MTTAYIAKPFSVNAAASTRNGRLRVTVPLPPGCWTIPDGAGGHGARRASAWAGIVTAARIMARTA